MSCYVMYIVQYTRTAYSTVVYSCLTECMQRNAGAAAGGIGGAAVGGVAGYTRDPIRVDEWKPDISLSITAREYALAYNATIKRARCDSGWTLEFAVPLVAALDSPVRARARFLVERSYATPVLLALALFCYRVLPNGVHMLWKLLF